MMWFLWTYKLTILYAMHLGNHSRELSDEIRASMFSPKSININWCYVSVGDILWEPFDFCPLQSSTSLHIKQRPSSNTISSNLTWRFRDKKVWNVPFLWVLPHFRGTSRQIAEYWCNITFVTCFRSWKPNWLVSEY